MKWNILIINIIFLVTACKKSPPTLASVMTKNEITSSNPAPTINKIQIKGDYVIIPDFKVEVNLSDLAVNQLQRNKESIIISLFFYGDVANEATLSEDLKKEIGPNGLKLGVFDIEKRKLAKSNEFDIHNIIIPKKLYNALYNKNIRLNINVFSGRRVFKDNILDMESFDSNLSDITSHTNFINLNGRLINEEKK
ncbi:hypothetical protein [Elizabethkingia bruuniana]|uniref:hypothetical protein n=1 Tax=Elizabethkingia bruuniana TaxID=1756149 RepID=UPI00241C2D8C|nr:hypothetical protein [Elizabethkingia bruuniana]